jgi:predicted ATP-grasp superfamily ATP-dependent carboligase
MNRRLLLLPVLAALTAVAILSPAASSARAPQGCSASNLVVWAGEEPGGGAAGSTYYRIEFTNLGSASCTVAGAPKVSAVDLHGKRVGAPATTEPGTKTRKLTLAPGDTASATLRIVEALNFPKAKCAPTLVAGLRVSVPGGSGSKVAPLAFETCAKAGSKTLSVAAVKAAN